MLHGDGLRKLSQHPLLEVLQPLVVITPTDKLLVLQKEESGNPCELVLSPQANLSAPDRRVALSKSLNKSRTLWIFGGGAHIWLFLPILS